MHFGDFDLAALLPFIAVGFAASWSTARSAWPSG
jgi:hypothetical protein